MKEATYLSIIRDFERWAEQHSRVCARGCTCCCTENVTITALEGERILAFALNNGMVQWMAERLRQSPESQRPRMTTNEFAHACLNGRDADPGGFEKLTSCPFLAEGSCVIYPVRPFSCRCFISTSKCSPSQPAQVSEIHLAASTAILQLIEHLGQKEYWGNMTDVLLALLDISDYQPIAEAVSNPARIMEGRLRTLTARPLPGFLFTEEEEQQIHELLTTVFTSRIGDGTVEDVLNGRMNHPDTFHDDQT